MHSATLRPQSATTLRTPTSTTTEDKVSWLSICGSRRGRPELTSSVYFIMQEFEKAIADYNKSTELDGGFIFTHVQAAVAQYKLGQVGPSMAAFRRILKNFPDRGEPSNY